MTVALPAGLCTVIPQAVCADDSVSSGIITDPSVIYEATIEADAVIIGTVIEKASYWNREHDSIYSSVVFSADEVLKGDVNGSIVAITYPGGETDGMGQWTSDMPDFTWDEKAVVFLRRLPPEEAPRTNDAAVCLPYIQFNLSGGFRGKYTIANGKAGDIPLNEFRAIVYQTLQPHFRFAGEAGVVENVASLPYSFSGNSWPHTTAAVVHYRINENCPDCTGEGAAVQAAAATWNGAGAKFAFVYDGTSTATTYAANSVNDISWGALSNGTLAFTCVWYNPANYAIFECDMVFNKQYTWSTADTPPPGQYDVESLALHELGHFLMLNDLYGAADATKAMYGVGIAGKTKRELHTADIAAINDVYGMAVRAPDIANGGNDNITDTAAKISGEILSTGTENPVAHVYWGPNDGGNETASWANDINLGALPAGFFFTDITGLSSGTTYYYRCYAVNSAGGKWADATASFTTLVPLLMDIAGSGTTEPATGTHLYSIGSNITISASPAVNYVFDTWTVEGVRIDTDFLNITIDAPKKFKAYFRRTAGTMAIKTDGEGVVTPEPGSYTYPVDTPVTLTAVPAAGWIFRGWEGGNGGIADVSSTNTTIKVNNDYDITAVFDRPVLTITQNGIGRVTPYNGTFPCAEGTLVDITASPHENWVFTNWSGDVTDPLSSATSVIMNTDKTIVANFTRIRGTVSMEMVGNGNIIPDPGTYTYNVTTPVNILAVPASGFSFASWSGEFENMEDASSANTTVTVNGDYIVRAVFEPVSTGSGGGGEGAAVYTKAITGLLPLTSPEGKLMDDISAESSDGIVKLTLPRGTSAKNTAGSPLPIFSITNMLNPDVPQPGTVFIGEVYEFYPAGAAFEPAVTLTFKYDGNALPHGVREDNLCIARWNKETQSYEPIPFEIDTENDEITAVISYFSLYTVLAIPKPADIEVSGITVIPGTVKLGGYIDIQVDLVNNGDLSGNYTCNVLHNNEPLIPQSITLNGKQETALRFTVKTGKPGENTVRSGEAESSFNVNIAPAAFSVSSLEISPVQVYPGQRIEICTVASNTGQAPGAYRISLTVNGDVIETRKITIAGETSREVRFAYSPHAAGEYAVNINGLTGTFLALKEVKPPGQDLRLTTVTIETDTTSPAIAGRSSSGAATIFMIFGGCMLAAAAIMYFVRQKKKSPEG